MIGNFFLVCFVFLNFNVVSAGPAMMFAVKMDVYRIIGLFSKCKEENKTKISENAHFVNQSIFSYFNEHHFFSEDFKRINVSVEKYYHSFDVCNDTTNLLETLLEICLQKEYYFLNRTNGNETVWYGMKIIALAAVVPKHMSKLVKEILSFAM